MSWNFALILCAQTVIGCTQCVAHKIPFGGLCDPNGNFWEVLGHEEKDKWSKNTHTDMVMYGLGPLVIVSGDRFLLCVFTVDTHH